jgi:CheY-like chemotaxis protein
LQTTNLELAEKARSNMAKDQFLAMLSHELRTPLTPVLASALALESQPALPAEIQDALQMIRRNVELEARLIDDLLDLTRIDRGKVQLNFEVVDAHSLLQNALDICQAEIDRKQLTRSLHLDAQKVYLQADPARLQQIFWNLINNAVKFTPKNGSISISTSNDSDRQLRVEIADNGLGIEPESLPKIFDAFEQGGRTQLGGLGLGLAISKRLVEAHKGTITAQSGGQNKGATFTLVFPTREKTEARLAPTAAPAAPVRHTKRILLVEDHEDTNRSLTNLLRRRGYQVHSALSFQSALDLSAKENFDVLISDLALPDGNGIDLIRTLQSNRPVFGIALTGFGMEEDIRRGREAGFQHHLVKPIDLNKLDMLIQENANILSAQ